MPREGDSNGPSCGVDRQINAAPSRGVRTSVAYEKG
jgi:hypothetical protein